MQTIFFHNRDTLPPPPPEGGNNSPSLNKNIFTASRAKITKEDEKVIITNLIGENWELLVRQADQIRIMAETRANILVNIKRFVTF